MGDENEGSKIPIWLQEQIRPKDEALEALQLAANGHDISAISRLLKTNYKAAAKRLGNCNDALETYSTASAVRVAIAKGMINPPSDLDKVQLGEPFTDDERWVALGLVRAWTDHMIRSRISQVTNSSVNKITASIRKKIGMEGQTRTRLMLVLHAHPEWWQAADA